MKLELAHWVLIALGVGLVVIPDPATTLTGLAIIAGVLGSKELE